MAKRKASEIGTARAHPGAPHNPPFSVTPKPGKKRKTWWNGFGRTASRKTEE